MIYAVLLTALAAAATRKNRFRGRRSRKEGATRLIGGHESPQQRISATEQQYEERLGSRILTSFALGASVIRLTILT